MWAPAVVSVAIVDVNALFVIIAVVLTPDTVIKYPCWTLFVPDTTIVAVPPDADFEEIFAVTDPEPAICIKRCIPAVKIKFLSLSKRPSIITDEPQWLITGAQVFVIVCIDTWAFPVPFAMEESGKKFTDEDVPVSAVATPEI